MPHKTTSLVLAVALLALAGCGSSSSSSTTASSTAPTTTSTTASSSSSATSAAPSTTAQSLQLAADPSGALKFNQSTLTAKAGKVTITFTNQSPLPHNLAIQGSSGSTVGATPIFSGGAKSLTVDLKAGTYTFFCQVPGHRQAGMMGTLTVT